MESITRTANRVFYTMFSKLPVCRILQMQKDFEVKNRKKSSPHSPLPMALQINPFDKKKYLILELKRRQHRNNKYDAK